MNNKIIIIIFARAFALWLMLLFSFPCINGDLCAAHSHERSGVIVVLYSNNNAEHTPCSPFCYCMCCSNVYSVNFASLANTVIPVGMKVNFPIPQHYLSFDLCTNCWQPPEMIG